MSYRIMTVRRTFQSLVHSGGGGGLYARGGG